MNRPLVVVTGAAGGLGRVVAQMFQQAGARLVLVDISESALIATFSAAQDDQFLVAVNLTNGAMVEDTLKPIFAQHGPATVLCNIAGGFSMGPAVHETTDQLWHQMLDLNVATVINACRAVVPAMIDARHGKIINIAAAGASSGAANKGAYCAAKSAVARLTESMALELRSQGINVNAVAPSIIDTPANRADMPDADFSQWVSPQDLSKVIGFLASADASAIHGAVIPVVGLC